jgi:uncharacterized SAM-binding protein YcdF (DUF218 family)
MLYGVAAGFAVFLAGFAWAFWRESRLIMAQPINAWTDDVTADCAVVVTGGPNRIREGLDLLYRRSVLKLIISGVHPQAEFREIFPVWPYYGEIKEHDVILERRSRTTYGNAQQSLALVEALRCRDLVLITSRSHMRRTLLTFRAEFPSGFPLITRAVPSTSFDPSWHELLVETMKSVFYSVWAY